MQRGAWAFTGWEVRKSSKGEGDPFARFCGLEVHA